MTLRTWKDEYITSGDPEPMIRAIADAITWAKENNWPSK